MWKQVPYRNLFLIAVVVNLIIIAALLLLRGFLPPVLPLLYGKPSGEAQLVKVGGLFVAPGASLLIIIMNIILSLWTKDRFLKKLLAVSAIFVSALIAITISKTILLVGFF